MIEKPLADRVALVTGASRGIGAATAIALARRGAHIIATVREKVGLEALEHAVAAADTTLEIETLEMTDPVGIAKLSEAVKDRHGRLDIMVGNAGVAGGPSVSLDKVNPKIWFESLDVNLTANWYLIRCFDALLRQSDAGRVVFISSGSAARTAALRGAYSVSKAALEALARTYANEAAESKLRVNIFNPGPIRTRMRAYVAPAEDPMTLDTPEQCAEKLADLCMPDYTGNGKLYDYRTKTYLEFRKPTF
jgi:NAD(P)-dependent dehydrogenase (short-subunit alcohol dehydrogenase family)